MTNKLKYFVGNWKMFGNFGSLKSIFKIHRFNSKFDKNDRKSKIVLCVPSTLIYYFTKMIKSSHVLIGAQNCHYEKHDGPYTGSVSASMLKSAGAKYIILGHSENRSQGDNNYLLKKKIESSLTQKLNVIYCIGESYKEKIKGKTLMVIKRQITESIDKKFDLNKIIIAYEPVWSIGTGKIPKTEELKKIFKFIKKIYKKRFKTNKTPKTLYGGSVNEKNISLFSSISEIDGFLIGGASQSPKKFIDIIKKYYK